MTTVYIGTGGRGTLDLPDGRTMKLNGFGGLAELSDGSQILISGIGYLQVPDMSTTTLTLTPTSGSSTTAAVQVTPFSGATEITPTGTLQVFVNGTAYGPATNLVAGMGSVNIGASAFPLPGNYNITVVYSGDSTYASSSATQVFVVPPH